MKQRKAFARIRTLIVTSSLALVGIVGVAGPASASTGNILPPFDIGTTWTICRGYDYASHTGTSKYGIDLTGPGCDNSAAGRNVRAPIDGTVYYYQTSYGNLCVNIAGNRSYTLTHIDSSMTSGSILTAGQLVGTVAAAQPDSNLPPHNNGVAHLHFQMWSASNCYNNSVIPFDSANNTQICGAPNLTPTGGPNSLNNGMWSGTVFTGAACGTNPNTYRTTFRANDGNLYMYDPANGAVNTALGVAANTSPVITPLNDGSFEIAFQAANSGSLYLYNTTSGVATNTTLGMATGTSPAVARLGGGGYEAAFQDNTGNLWVYGSAGTHNLGLGMAAGTSPAITGLGDGSYEVAFQANSGSLYLYNPSTGATNLALGMASGTSPSIAGLRNGGFEVAFQDNTGNLWVYGNGGTHDLALGVATGTSPAITGLVDGTYKVAFQASGSGSLYFYDPANGAVNTALGVAIGTSPSIYYMSGGGYEAAFQDNQGNLWVYGSAGNADTLLGMSSGTSPAMG